VIAGRFEITIDEVDELVEAIAMRTAGRLAAMFGHDPDAAVRRRTHHRPTPTRRTSRGAISGSGKPAIPSPAARILAPTPGSGAVSRMA
jgi:hypothetical protein